MIVMAYMVMAYIVIVMIALGPAEALYGHRYTPAYLVMAYNSYGVYSYGPRPIPAPCRLGAAL